MVLKKIYILFLLVLVSFRGVSKRKLLAIEMLKSGQGVA